MNTEQEKTTAQWEGESIASFIAAPISVLTSAIEKYSAYQRELGRKESKWISVSERKPEQGEYVLVHALGGRRMAAAFKDGKFLCYDLTDEEFVEVEYPMHWQPLPVIPNEKSIS